MAIVHNEYRQLTQEEHISGRSQWLGASWWVRTYNGGLAAEPQAGSRGSGGEAPWSWKLLRIYMPKGRPQVIAKTPILSTVYIAIAMDTGMMHISLQFHLFTTAAFEYT